MYLSTHSSISGSDIAGHCSLRELQKAGCYLTLLQRMLLFISVVYNLWWKDSCNYGKVGTVLYILLLLLPVFHCCCSFILLFSSRWHATTLKHVCHCLEFEKINAKLPHYTYWCIETSNFLFVTQQILYIFLVVCSCRLFSPTFLPLSFMPSYSCSQGHIPRQHALSKPRVLTAFGAYILIHS